MAETLPGRDWAIVPAHNRRELTLGCLRHLRETGTLVWLRVCVVDDGSTDGTADAVRAEFPGVLVLRGDGHLWWTGAIARGMAHALANAECETIFWLNDDCRPAAGALERLRAEALAGLRVAVAQVDSPAGLRFGGWRRHWRGLALAAGEPDAVVSVDTMNGNCVCVPAAIARRVGLPDAARFPQAYGDTDFGLRCGRAGFDVVVVSAVVCHDVEPADRDKDSWLRGGRSVAEIARSFRSPRNYFYPPPWWRFCIRHWGAWGAVLFVAPYLRFGLIALLRAVTSSAMRRRWFAAREREQNAR
ncbi:MAG: glycosyltransferase family 2 protein [Verrucomicrobia bacterium]|nr:glycosyltransferase family 2 protein [Verrucomicrobiota bacterium]